MQKRISAILLTSVLAACGGGGGGASISTSKAVTPSTPEAAAGNLQASLGAVGEFGSLGAGFAGVGKPAAKASKMANAVVEKLRAQQDIGSAFCDAPSSVSENKVVCDCEAGGKITISGDFASIGAGAESGNIKANLKIAAANCKETYGDGKYEETSNGTIAIDIEGTVDQSTGALDMSVTVSLDGAFTTKTDGTVTDELLADISIVQEINSDTEGLTEAAANATDPNAEPIDPDDYIQIFQSMDGAISLISSENACSDGVFVLDTIEKLQAGGCAGFKAGKIDINGVTYAFAESEVTMSGGVSGTVACEDLGGAICEQ